MTMDFYFNEVTYIIFILCILCVSHQNAAIFKEWLMEVQEGVTESLFPAHSLTLLHLQTSLNKIFTG